MSEAIPKAEATLTPVAPSLIKSQVPPNLLNAPPLRPVLPPKPVVPPPKPAQDNKEIECIDLTDDSDLPSASNSTAAAATATATAATAPKFKSPVPVPSSSTTPPVLSGLRHPAPLPVWPVETYNKTSEPPPKPRLKISAEKQGIILQWDMPLNINQVKISSYEIFGYQELKQTPITSSLWVKIGLVQAMSLPMACTLTQFQEGHTYHFTIRAIDVNNRCGAYSDPATIIFAPHPAHKNVKV
ncbi:activating transcription factor 7-interacting protein 1-like [Stegodyphus dumicola]|uniref:activating transcription factor 7-interacting protein 1-like n=1 Tax=Stegodyphus dumicola TaxID=202533 RepID=UPI0015AABDCB|nr:activating transcription factor 7-interacting protein 1-like [Stegodyphus dumicola]